MGGIYILSTKVNNITASLGAGNILLYAGVYTPLKQLSIVNTWIGAVVGAVPPLMGWAGAIGKLDYGALLLAAGLYFWQMPHFMALAWLCRKDYALGGYKMLSLVDSTGKRTAACALRNCMYLFPLGTLSTWLGITSPYFAYGVSIYNSRDAANCSEFLRQTLKHQCKNSIQGIVVALACIYGSLSAS